MEERNENKALNNIPGIKQDNLNSAKAFVYTIVNVESFYSRNIEKNIISDTLYHVIQVADLSPFRGHRTNSIPIIPIFIAVVSVIMSKTSLAKRHLSNATKKEI